MNERKLVGDAESLSHGRLEGISLPDLIWMLRAGRKTGVLRVQRNGIEKSIYFDQGTIVFAASTDSDDRLGELLLRQGTITLDQLEAALADLHLGKRLGTLLVEAGAMGADKLVSAVLTQVQTIVLDLFTWERGEYRFEEGTLPTDEVITLNMKTNEILRSGIRRIRSFGRTRRSVGPPRTVYGLAERWEEETEGQSLSEPEQLLIDALSQGDRSIDRLCREVMLSNFEIHETLWVLKVQGVVVERVGRFDGDDEASHHGNLEGGGFIKAIVGLSRERATGVLYVRRRSDERSFHFRHGRCEFATSSNPDHGLVAFLLMRGVISLRDREETDKRLLSNKRVGTILRELGVIDDKDLHMMVRQQLSEIVYDTFRFEDGDLSFVPCELPSIEEITLETTAESLVLEGLRRVSSWSRVKQSCGGMDTLLELTPDYMDVLDAMGAGAAEWQVVTALKSARSAREICRETKLDDFRTCQILWALRELGAVCIAPTVAESNAAEAVPLRPAEPAEIAPGAVAAVVDPAPAGAEPAVAESDSPLPPPGLEAPAGEAHAAAPGGGGPIEIEVQELDPPGGSEVPVEPSPAPAFSAQQTQVISREAVEAALGGKTALDPEPPRQEATQVDATQAIPRQTVEAALGGIAPAAPPCEAGETDGDVEASGASGASEASEGIEAIEIDESFSAKAVAACSADVPSEPAPGPHSPVEAAPPDATPSIWDLETSTRTMQLPREEVDAALAEIQASRGDAAEDPTRSERASESRAAAEPWELPGDLEAIIERFNAMQRVVYRAIRAEVGAGAANFIRSCCDTTPDSVDPLKGAELQSDGSWDSEGLRRAVEQNRIRDPRLVYQALIEREIDLLRSHIGDARVLEIERQIEKVEQASAGNR